MGARFADRIGKGIRGAPRDGMIADETPPEIRGRAFGLRQSLDTVGAMIAPIAAIGLMVWFAGQYPRGVLDRGRSRRRCRFLLAWLALQGAERAPRRTTDRARRSSPASASSTGDAAADRGRLPVHAGALLGRLPDPARVRRRAVARPCRRWCWCCSTSPSSRSPTRPGRSATASAPRRS